MIVCHLPIASELLDLGILPVAIPCAGALREVVIMRKPFWLAVLAYLVPTFPLGYFWHLVAFADRYHQLRIYRDEVIIPLGLTSMVIQALVFAWAYPRLFPVARVPWQRGAIGFGCIFGVMAWSFVVLPVAAKYRMASVQDFIVLETCFTALQFAVVSPLIALACQLDDRRSASAVSA
jgi:hypothetical protein